MLIITPGPAGGDMIDILAQYKFKVGTRAEMAEKMKIQFFGPTL